MPRYCHWFSKEAIASRTIQLRELLVFPFVLEVVGVVGIVGYLSYRSGQHAVQNLAYQLMEETGDRLVQHLDTYLGQAQAINQINLATFQTGLLDVNDGDELGAYFYHQAQQFDFAYVNFGSPEGTFIGAGYGSSNVLEIAEITEADPTVLRAYAVDEEGDRQQILVTETDTQTNNAAWYIDAVQAGQPIWSSVYTWGDLPDRISISASAPVYGDGQELMGVFGIDLELTQISHFLQTVEGDRTGGIFILERSGLMIANSEQESAAPIINGIAQRIDVRNSQASLIRTVSQQLTHHIGDFQSINESHHIRLPGDEPSFAYITPYTDGYGLDWLIVLVLPESSFMADIYSNVQRTVALCVVAFLSAISIGLWTSRRVTRSLSRLVHATQAITDGQLEQPLQPTRIQEIDTLAESLRQMAASLQDAARLRQTYQQELERQVAEKTEALNEAQRIAHVGSWECDLATQEVVWSREMYRIYEAEAQYPVSRPDLTILQIHPNDQERYQREVIERAIAHQPFDADLRIITQKGTVRHIQARGQPMYNTKGEVVKLVGTVADISDRKRTEELLYESEARFRGIVEDQTEIIKRFRPDGTQIFVNDAFCRYHGVSREEVIGHRFLPRVHPDDQAIVKRSLATLSPDQPVCTIEHRVIVQGEVRWMQWVNRAIYDGKGTLIELQAVGRDVHDRKQAEMALERATQELQALLDYAPAIISVFSADGRYLQVNRSFARLIGRPEADIVGKSFSDFFPDAVIRVFETRIRRLLDVDEPLEVEDEIEVNGDRKIFRTILFPVFNDAEADRDNPTIGAIAIDITERKRIENALNKKTDELDQFFTVALDLLCIADTDGYFHRLNSQWEKTLGYGLNELEGSRYLDYVHPDDMNETLATIAALEAQREVHNFVNRYRCADGTYRWIEWRAVPIGKLVYAAARDITDRKQAEFLLRESEETLATVFHANPAPAWITTLNEGRFLEVNDAMCQFVDAPVDAIIGKTYTQLGIWDNPGDFQVFRQILQTTRRLPSFEVVWRTQSGQAKTVLIAASVSWLKGQDCVIGVLSDISDRKQTELEMSSALEQRETLLQEVYHRVKNNLQLILDMLHMHQQRLEDDDAIRALRESGDRVMAISLIHELLYQSGSLEEVDLAEYLPTVVNYVADAYQAKARAIAIDIQVQPIVISLKQAMYCGLILNELVTNALKYAFPDHQGGSVVITLLIDEHQKNKVVCLSVQDDGVGLPSEAYAPTRRTLGLRLVHDFVKQLPGTLAIANHKGTQFSITFQIPKMP